MAESDAMSDRLATIRVAAVSRACKVPAMWYKSNGRGSLASPIPDKKCLSGKASSQAGTARETAGGRRTSGVAVKTPVHAAEVSVLAWTPPAERGGAPEVANSGVHVRAMTGIPCIWNGSIREPLCCIQAPDAPAGEFCGFEAFPAGFDPGDADNASHRGRKPTKEFRVGPGRSFLGQRFCPNR